MVPNHLFHEYLVRERVQELQREAEQQRMLARLPKSRPSMFRYLIGRIGALFVILGSAMQQLEQRRVRL